MSVNEAEWLACDDPARMWEFLRGPASDRKVRLFAIAAWRQVRHENEYQRLVRAVDTAERYADGLVGVEELLNVKSLAWDVATGLQRDVFDVIPQLRGTRPWRELLAAYACEQRADTLALRVSQATAWEKLRRAAPALIRDIFGNPFRPVPAADPAWLAWQGGVVRDLARAAYEERRMPEGTMEPARLAELADALEGAGGGDAAELLGHLRGPGGHVRGCWPVDLLLGKE